ncbi:MAG: SPOR domain-containing protein [Muribaculaceae bacterium]|nr:SPOR domain-containing protein [Muribaculaceae bacterium]
MKRIINRVLPLLLLAVLGIAVAGNAQAAKKTGKKPQKVYYLVCGSYSTLEQAKQASENMSEVLFYPVYKAQVKGKTVYRLCCECFYSKKKALSRAEELKSMFFSEMWVWESNGLAECVYVPTSPADEPGVEEKPLVPQW